MPPGKFTMILLIELYLEWLLVTLPLDTAAFVVINNICPNPADLNVHSTPPTSGCQHSGAVLKVPGQLKKLKDIVCEKLTFSFFVEGVLSGGINTDGLPKFSQHMAASYQAMEEAYRKIEQRHLADPSIPLPAYKPPPRPKAKSKRQKTKSKPGYTYFEKQLKNAYTFHGSDNEEDGDDDNAHGGDYEKRDLAKTFHELLEQNAIRSVKFKQSTLKELYANDAIPKGGIGTKLFSAVDGFLAEKKQTHKEIAKEKRDAKKRDRGTGSVQEEERAQDASPIRQSPRTKRQRMLEEADQQAVSETRVDDDDQLDEDDNEAPDQQEASEKSEATDQSEASEEDDQHDEDDNSQNDE